MAMQITLFKAPNQVSALDINVKLSGNPLNWDVDCFFALFSKERVYSFNYFSPHLRFPKC